MPTGRRHTSATIIASGLLALTAAALIYQTQRVEWLALPVGAMAGLLLSPDLDVNGGSDPTNDNARQLGWLFRWIWRIYWYPYALIVPHRGESHIPIVGTLVRLVYLGWWIPLVINPLPWAWIATGAAGLAIVDLLHVGMDAL